MHEIDDLEFEDDMTDEEIEEFLSNNPPVERDYLSETLNDPHRWDGYWERQKESIPVRDDPEYIELCRRHNADREAIAAGNSEVTLHTMRQAFERLDE